MPLLALALSAAFALPDIDEPVKTGAKAPGDAALIVGIEDYFLLPDVPHADADARAFREFLRYTRGVPEARLRSLGKGANREQILTAMDELAPTVAEGATLWVYFAGHGAADPSSGERVLLGADTQADQATFQARAVKLSELRTKAKTAKGNAIFVLDTCYSGRARGGGDLVAGKRFAVPAYATKPEAKLVEWTAAGPGEWSGPLEAANHGAFTYAVLGALRGWADGQVSGTPDGKVTVDEAHAYVTESLLALGITDQHPHVLGDVSLVVSTGTEPKPDLTGGRDDRDDDADHDDATDTGAPPAAPEVYGDPSLPGQLQIQSSALVMFFLDGAPLLPTCEGCLQLEAYGLSSGPHRLEVRSAFGKVLIAEDIQIGGGQQLRLHYAKKQLTEVGRGPAVDAPAPTPRPAMPNAGYGQAPALDGYDANLERNTQLLYDVVMQQQQQIIAPANQAPSGYGMGLDDPWFLTLAMAVESEGFADRKVQIALSATANHGITMAQLAILLDMIPYGDDRKALLMGVAPSVVDPANVGLLQPSLPFGDEQRLAAQLFGG